MKTKHKLLSVVLSVAMLLCMFPQMAFAGEDAEAQCQHIDANQDHFCDTCHKYCGDEETIKQEVKLVLEREATVTFHVGKDGKGAEVYAENKGFNEEENCYIYEIEVPKGGYSCTVIDENVNWGGVGFDMPLQSSIYEPTNIKLVACKYYTTNANIKNVDDFYLDIKAPGKCELIEGENYLDSSIKDGATYVVAPRMVWAYGNQILYNSVAQLKGDIAKTMGSAYQINQTFASSLKSVQKKTFSISNFKTCSVTVPSAADVTFYHQINNFNDTVISGENNIATVDNEDGTKTFTAKYPSFSNGSFRINMPGYVTAAGYSKDNTAYTYTTDAAAVEQDKTDNPKKRTVFLLRKDEDGSLAKSTETNIDSKAGAGSNIEYENSVYLNVDDTKDTNELALNVGDTFRLRAFRAAWEIVNTVTANIMIEPDMNYEVLTGKDVVSVSPVTSQCTGNAKGNWMDITGLKEGTAVIAVWYDAIDVGGNTTFSGTYGATDPARYGYVVVNVGPDKTIKWNPISHDGDWDAEFDTVYYYGDNGTFSFKPEGASKVTVQNFNKNSLGEVKTVTAEEGQYNVPVVSGSNLISVETEDGTDYMLVRAKKISYTIENKTTGKTNADEDFEVTVGDEVCIHFDQFNMPISKMSGIYNPGYMGTAKTIFRLNNKYTIASVGTQYDYITDEKSCITFKAQLPGKNVLSEGFIQSGSMGDDFGNHRNITDAGRGTNFSAVNVTGYFGSIEGLEFDVKDNPEYVAEYSDFTKITKGSIFVGDSSYNCAFTQFSLSGTTKDNNFINWNKTTELIQSQDTFALKANVLTSNYYTDLELRYWYEGDEVKTVEMISGSDTIIPQDVLNTTADKILNMEVVVTPGDSKIGPSKVYSFVVIPGNANLKYVHPIMTSLTATDSEGENVNVLGNFSYTQNNGMYEMLTNSETITLTGKMLQKATSSTNKTQDNSDKVVIQKYKDGEKVGEEIVAQEAGDFPTGTWTLENLNITDADQLKVTVTSYVDDKTSRTYNVYLNHPVKKVEAVAATCTEEGSNEYYVCESCGKYYSDAEGTKAIEKDSWVISAKGHNTKLVNAKKATYLAKGYTGDLVCKDCSTVIEKGKAIAKLKQLTQKITAKKASLTYYAKSLKKKAASITLGAKAQGKLTYKVTKGTSKNITVSKAGKVTLKKNCKKGTYKITITAAQTKSGKYKKATKVITVKVK